MCGGLVRHPRGRIAESGGDDGDPQFGGGLGVDDRTENHVRIGADRLLDDAGDLTDFVQAHVGSTGDVDEHALGSTDVDVLEQWRADRGVGRLQSAALPLCNPGPHDRVAHPGHDAPHIGEVEVHQTRHGDEIADSLGGLVQHLVGHPEGIEERGVGGDHFEQPVVGDHDDRVHLVAEGGQPLARLRRPFASLETERQRHDAHDQGAQIPGDPRHRGSGPGTGAPTHPRGHEDHVGAGEGFGHEVVILLDGLLSHPRISATPEAARDLAADLDPRAGITVLQGLGIGVHRQEVHSRQSGLNHSIDGVAAGAPDSHDTDLRTGGELFLELHQHDPDLRCRPVTTE